MSKKNSKSEIKRCTYYIDGMHCASCEVLIEKKMLKDKSVKSVEASLSSNRVEFTYEGKKPDIDLLNDEFSTNGYTFSESKITSGKQKPLFELKGGQLYINDQKLKSFVSILLVLTILFTLFYFFDKSGIAGRISVDSTSSYFTFFLFGIFAGLSSCAALVGGLLLSLSKQWSLQYIESDSLFERMKPFTMFNLGRIISFILLGGVLGFLGGLIGIDITKPSVITSIVIVLVALIMAFMGLQMLGVKWASRFQIKTPKFLSHRITNTEKFSGKYMPIIVGALTFLLPCGFTLVAQGLALTSGSFFRGAMIMFAFALGTFPVLFLIGISSAATVVKPRINYMFSTLAGILVLLFAIYNINAQLNLLGIPSLNDIRIDFSSDGKGGGTVVVGEDGYQTLDFVAQGFAYIPKSSTTLKAGVPAKIRVDNQGIQGCGAYMAARGLFDGYIFLEPGSNEVVIENPVAGTYKLTCSMGMVSPVTIKVI